MLKNLRARSKIETNLFIKNSINHQLSLEIGLSPKYLSLGEKKKSQGTWLQDLKINPNEGTR